METIVLNITALSGDVLAAVNAKKLQVTGGAATHIIKENEITDKKISLSSNEVPADLKDLKIVNTDTKASTPVYVNDALAATHISQELFKKTDAAVKAIAKKSFKDAMGTAYLFNDLATLLTMTTITEFHGEKKHNFILSVYPDYCTIVAVKGSKYPCKDMLYYNFKLEDNGNITLTMRYPSIPSEHAPKVIELTPDEGPGPSTEEVIKAKVIE